MEKVEKAKKGRILPYILFCLLPLAGGALSGLISRSGMDRYEALFAVDKSRARQGRRRIRERTLLLWVWAGGSLGGLLGMDLLRHKTRHPRFYIGLPAALLVHLAILGALWVRFFH